MIRYFYNLQGEIVTRYQFNRKIKFIPDAQPGCIGYIDDERDLDINLYEVNISDLEIQPRS